MSPSDVLKIQGKNINKKYFGLHILLLFMQQYVIGVCVCVYVYVVYEDTNLYNDMGMT